MNDRVRNSKRPYLIRAMHGWMMDNGETPHVIVDAEKPGVEVPRAYVKDGKVVLNLSSTATQRLVMGNDWIEFEARFAGVVHHVRIPVSTVLGIYARESGEGMVLSETDLGPEPTNKQGDFRATGSAIGVGFVKHENEHRLGIACQPIPCLPKNRPLDGPEQHVLKHRVVGD